MIFQDEPPFTKQQMDCIKDITSKLEAKLNKLDAELMDMRVYIERTSETQDKFIKHLIDKQDKHETMNGKHLNNF